MFNDVGLMTGDLTINPSASCIIMTTEVSKHISFSSFNISSYTVVVYTCCRSYGVCCTEDLRYGNIVYTHHEKINALYEGIILAVLEIIISW